MSFLAMLEEMPAFGQFDTAANTPIVSFDPKRLVQTVEMLWDNAKRQRLLMEAMEGEMAKRKTETEVRLRTMQNDLEGLVRNEAKRREQEDDSIRAELAKLGSLIDDKIQTVDADARQREDDLQRSVDRTTAAIKGGLLETQGKVSALSVEVDELRRSLASIQSNNGNADLDGLMRAMDERHGLICSFIGSSPEGVARAVATNNAKEAFLKVPALVDLGGRLRTAESVANAALTDVKSLEGTVSEVADELKTLRAAVDHARESIKECEVRVTDGFGEGDRKLHKRIDDLAGRLTAPAATEGAYAPVPVDVHGSAISSLRDELAELAKRVRKAEHDLDDKASLKDVSLKASLEDLDPIWEAVNKLVASVDSHTVDIADLKARPHHEKHHDRVTERIIEPSPPRDDPRIGEILIRLSDTERMCKHLDDVKADKHEVNAALKDLMKRVEKALNALLARIQDLELAQSPTDATAGRFKCLSCNRNAGPLQEQLSERMSSSQFPPSTVYVGQRPSSATSRPASAIPGMRDYGGGMTSSRKKLMNYYTWLQDRADSPGQSTQQEVTRSKSPSLKHPWPGAQSGNGEAGERQCGDKGSAEPDAIGSDGKFYVGVIGRPQSASRRVDVNI